MLAQGEDRTEAREVLDRFLAETGLSPDLPPPSP
jgi:hypothetical protein